MTRVEYQYIYMTDYCKILTSFKEGMDLQNQNREFNEHKVTRISYLLLLAIPENTVLIY